jgi:hypothetical protein
MNLTDDKLESKIVILAGLFITIFNMSIFENPAQGYWDTYITAPAMIMAGEKINFTLKDGSLLYDYALKNRLPDDLVDRKSYDIISKDQRIGSGITFSPAFALFNQFGFRFLYGLIWGLLFICSFVLFKKLLEKSTYAFIGALALTVNPYMLTLNRLNPNLIVLPLIALIYYLLITKRYAFLTGVLYGIAGGIRNEAIVIFPSMLIFLLSGKENKTKILDLSLFFTGAFLGILPILYWNNYAFGTPLIHSSQYSGFKGFRPEFVHSFSGYEFRFNGLLNYPFHNEIIRTPHFAYPVFFLFPMVAIRSFGIILCSLGIFGIYRCIKNTPRTAISMLLWALSIYALFAFQENWEEVKQTFMILGFIPVIYFIAAGMKEALTQKNKAADKPHERSECRFLPLFRRRKAPRNSVTSSAAFLSGDLRPLENIIKNLVAVSAICAILFCSVKLLKNVDVPADNRWYQRFPHAALNESNLNGLPENMRNDWVYFHTKETDEEIDYEKQKLTSCNFLPALYLPLSFKLQFPLDEINREIRTRELTILAVWEYIYGG